MKQYLSVVFVVTLGCNNAPQKDATTPPDTQKVPDHTRVEVQAPDTVVKPSGEGLFSNERFRDVRVEQEGEHLFRVTGKGQVFEASLGWVVEDGHEELKKGFSTTDEGAPSWGNFSFTVDVEKRRANSTLHLILFETSAKDGSRQHELAVPLY